MLCAVRFAPVLLAVLALAGCGGGSGSTTEGEGGAPRPADEQFASSCGSCHTLADAGTSGSFGPDLDELMPDEALVLSAIAEGPGGMPAGLLEGAAADEMAAYVAGAAGSDGS